MHADHTHNIIVHQETGELITAKLKINKSIVEDGGEYICKAESDGATQIGTFDVQVQSNDAWGDDTH